MKLAKVGAISYIIWSLLHIGASLDEFRLGSTLEPGLVQGKINQGAWDLLFFALFAIVIAVKFNWKNDSLGYWLNLIVVSTADIGFIIFVLLPGHIAVFPGILGPIFWILGAVFSTLGIRTKTAG
jgi:hypothetical protein